MNDERRRVIEQTCRDLMLEMIHASDHFEVDKLADLFTEDGERARGDTVVRGRDNIRNSYPPRRPTVVTRHIIGGTVVDVLDDDNATAVTYYFAISNDPQTTEPTLPIPFRPLSMGEYHTRFARTEDGWRLARNEVHRIFEYQDCDPKLP